MIDLTWPVSIAVFFAGAIALLVTALPRCRVAACLAERVKKLNEAAEHLINDVEALQKEHKEHDRRLGSLQNQLSANKLGR